MRAGRGDSVGNIWYGKFAVSARECICNCQFMFLYSSQTCKGQRVRFLFIMQYGNIWEFGMSLNNGEEGDGAEKMDRVADCEHVG